MCMGDIAIGRATKSALYYTQSEVVLPANANRIAVRIVAGLNDNAELYTAGPIIGDNPFLGRFLIGLSSYAAGTVSAVNDVTLLNVGEILRGELILVAQQAAGVFAIDVLLEANIPSLAEYQQWLNSPSKILEQEHIMRR